MSRVPSSLLPKRIPRTHIFSQHLKEKEHSCSILMDESNSTTSGSVVSPKDGNHSGMAKDPHIMDVLTLDIKTQRYNMRPQAQILVLIYRIYYKAMTTICPTFMQIDDPGKSVILFQSKPDKTNVMLPRRIKFSELTPLEDWNPLDDDNSSFGVSSQPDESITAANPSFGDGSVATKDIHRTSPLFPSTST
ncbi:hypothetical protein RJ640_022735 [Escallonia rubra]|uniref:Uncharacterized protein n=1 Tax=Escallonia rubra TaxID=112253 RepID=A0AA88UVI6_9ASTE|nr:hypothetical protein RJ640_022735 [Escallonia rubra]